jgi:benzoyl-CoA reductase/2-hydroxyglutaryl-CoA dehydratase subunit BcrC/BadD/HgdB
MRVFLSSPWIPAEWIRAHKLEARGIWFAGNIRRAASPLPAGVCAFAENAVSFAETQPDSAVIFTTACDQLRRGFDTATSPGHSHTFLFNLPATQTSAAQQIYRAELERLGHFLVELGGHPPTPNILRNEMLQTEAARRRLRESAPTVSGRSFAEAVARFHDGNFLSAPSVSTPGNQVPLALVGGPLSLADWNLFDTIENAGGRVVLNATENGERSLCPQFENAATSNGSFTAANALMDGYFENITDVFQRPNTRLYAWLKPRLASRQARGIVLWHYTGCDLWRAEAHSLREAFGMPVLLLEAGDATAVSPRNMNRLQAFVETLR